MAGQANAQRKLTEVAALRRTLQWILGGLWLLDSFLQMQPGMFTMDMVSTIMQPNLQGQPAWLAAWERWSIHMVTAQVGWWNFGFAGIQFVIAVLILMDRPRTVRAGLWLSVGWGLLVWIFGEGLGGILTGGATMLAGAPGSVILYVWLAALLLVPEERWGLDRRFSWARDGIAGLWILGALQQAAPGYWQGIGLSSVFQSNASMQPGWFAQMIYPLVASTDHWPLWWNGLFVLVPLVVGLLTLGRPARPWAFWLGWAYLAFVWVFGQGLGMILTGMGTDPNAAPLWALLMLPGWLAAVSHRQQLGQAAPAGAQAATG